MVAKPDDFRSLLPFTLALLGSARLRKWRDVRPGRVRHRRIAHARAALPPLQAGLSWHRSAVGIGWAGRPAIIGLGASACTASWRLIVFELSLYNSGDQGRRDLLADQPEYRGDGSAVLGCC